MGIAIGQQLGSYEVTALLGKGGSGEVYLAQDVKLGRQVALKFLKTNLAFGPEQIRDLLNEARAAAALSHPNVATIHEVNESNGIHFIVMEYVEGETLKTKIANNSLSQKDLQSLVIQIIDALEAAHSKGVVHSDLKPANIMVTPRGQVKLLDFGLAKRFNATHSCIRDSTVTEIEPGLLAGTLAYMSPEQALGQNIDHRSDIFSLGVVLYEAATGCLPFTGLTPIDTINRIINVDPRPIADLSPSIPAKFGKIILRCLVKKPEGRYQRAADILQDLTKSKSISYIESLSSVRNNLPNQLTNFIGREREITTAKQLLAQTRILTLTGTGGIGKTRLALSVAIEKLDDYPDGVWFVDLSTLSDTSLVASAIATSATIQGEPQHDVLERICDYFAERCSLLVIDNCEHLITACAKVLSALLCRCTKLSILATSREPLMVPGENIFRVPSLSLPDPGCATDELLKYEALRLFADRATAIRPDFVVDANNASDLVGICCELDGIPLAIELAASRIKALSLKLIRSRLNERFRLLTTGPRTAQPRQQTLRATLDWSHNLLSDREQTLFRRVSIFAGGFTLEAAEDVCSGDGIDRHEVMDLLAQLVDKSLVLFTQETLSRYRLLETVREFSREKLEQESTELHGIQRKHAEFYVRFVECGKPELLGEHQLHWFHLIANDCDNIRWCLQWLRSQRDGAGAMLRTVSAMRQFWLVRGEYNEGREWAKDALERCSDRWNIDRAGALETAGDLANAQGDHRSARIFHEELLEVARLIESPEWIGRASLSLGHVAALRSDLEAARSYYEQSLSAFERAGYRLGVAGALGSMGSVAHTEANYHLARTHFERALAIFRELGAKEGIASCLLNLGQLAYIQNDIRLGRALLDEGLISCRAIGSRPRVAQALAYLSEIAEAEGDSELARSLITESLGIAHDLGAKTKIAAYLNILGNIAALEHKDSEARVLYQESLSIATAVSDKRSVAFSTNGLARLASKEGQYDLSLRLHRESLLTFREIGYKIGLVDSLGLIIVDLVSIGDAHRAAYLFGALETILEAIDTIPPSSERILIRCKTVVAEASRILGAEKFMLAKAAGNAMTLDQAMECAFNGFDKRSSDLSRMHDSSHSRRAD